MCTDGNRLAMTEDHASATHMSVDDVIMPDYQPRPTRISFSVSVAEAKAIDTFRISERLPSRADAVRLLLEIALDGMKSTGRRFWDRAPAAHKP